MAELVERLHCDLVMSLTLESPVSVYILVGVQELARPLFIMGSPLHTKIYITGLHK